MPHVRVHATVVMAMVVAVVVMVMVVTFMALVIVVVLVSHGGRIRLQRLEFDGLRHGHGLALLGKRGQDRGEAQAVDQHKIRLFQVAALLRGQGKRVGVVRTGEEAAHRDGGCGKRAGQVTQHPVGCHHLGTVCPLSGPRHPTATCRHSTQQQHRQGCTSPTLSHGS